ncbi:MAG: S9 family peptidase, partial [Fluviicola sp.]
SWIPGTEEFVYVADGFQTLKKSSAKSATESDFLKIADVNTALGAKLPYFFGYSWKSATELYLSDGMNFYVYNTQAKKGSSIISLQEGASNQVQETTTGKDANTKENNMSVHQANGKASTV